MAAASTERNSSASRTQILLSQPPMQNSLSTDNWTNWVPGWRPFHTNLLVFSSQADFQLTTEHSLSPTSYFTSLHSTELPTTELSHSPTSYFTSLHSTELLTTELSHSPTSYFTSLHSTELSHSPTSYFTSLHSTELPATDLSLTTQLLHVSSLNWTAGNWTLSHQPATSRHFTQLNSLTHQPATSRHFTQLNCWKL
jgi:hypothetical protein